MSEHRAPKASDGYLAQFAKRFGAETQQANDFLRTDLGMALMWGAVILVGAVFIAVALFAGN
ncbi:hypothetical protein CGZ93_08470 [Enemella dayhoffiae]|uniref:Uncharacterized protein n=1 Tax=Enemella dayhoffiae TaxID=2016507 RepID=A0A255H2X8_9ACTN|nr:hypothetical protein [Enemella dayhoffiae]OYO21960.1 hypothetical protein CGZ93_08470 [Enemella dayhoffiae]